MFLIHRHTELVSVSELIFRSLKMLNLVQHDVSIFYDNLISETAAPEGIIGKTLSSFSTITSKK